MTPDKQRHLEAEWLGWEPLIQSDKDKLQHRIQACYAAMSVWSTPRAEREAYVLQRIHEMILESGKVKV